MITASEYCAQDGLGLAELVRRGDVTPVELARVALDGIERLDPKLNAVVTVLREGAEGEAAACSTAGPFAGVPFLIKELVLHAAGVPVGMGSRLACDLTMPHDSELMARFRRAGLVTVATSASPEFGFNASTESIAHGPTRNPWNLERSSGGSSGGSAAAVAAGIAPLAHANDGGGSIRIPAACCGLVGLKPTRGRTPTGPDYADPLNGLGIEFAVTRSVRDAAALLDAVAGPDPGAPHWAEAPRQPFAQAVRQTPGRLRIAWSARPPSGVPVDRACVEALHATVKLLESLGHELVETAPSIDAEALLVATHRVWAANLAHWMDGLSTALNRPVSEDTVEATSFGCYREGMEMKASQLLQALDV
ncbi:MAG TPA: amidase family protein, partial [Polyangiaceae bacterium]|nr:amidase family protein [Polyangiaceae bacterium]